ncbi:Metallo-dependent phosphatase-like protein [Schizophyllum amplum]|uniref:Endopolyphosphatase n=1 Tax=Schizophyllum amplum TaxID=97359 RepID=A0A550CS11_9AGAR|nr:Metallo-dependent phosphatase-like protein [Auriculariopsis ampla]
MRTLCLLLLVAASDALAAPAQQPFSAPTAVLQRKLTGRFLHITDIHPDPYYTAGASVKRDCHRKKPRKKKNRAGYYGTSYSDCDSPPRLANFTLDYLDREWTDDIDFVIWTGDNARHDNDRKTPRTLDEIYTLNRAVAAKMEKVFLRKGIPVIPSLGNNDVWPHNILMPGPNAITNEFASIWRSFIPFHYLQVFQRGAYYATEVIPNAIAVVSLNTMYFYDSNHAVGGCEYGDLTDPGNLELDWLAVQLQNFRQRGMHVYLSGHVPPSPGNFFPECHVRYTELSLRYQDTILGHFYGHMNADHFFFIEEGDLDPFMEDEVGAMTTLEETRGASEVVTSLFDPSTSSEVTRLQEDGPGPLFKSDLWETLVDDFGELPGEKKVTDLDEYAVVNVGPSVVPNPYVPTFRVYAYNVTGAEGLSVAAVKAVAEEDTVDDEDNQALIDEDDEDYAVEDDDDWDSSEEGHASDAAGSTFGEDRANADLVEGQVAVTGKRKHGHRRGPHGRREKLCKDDKYQHLWTCHLQQPWHSDSAAPSRRNTLWTPLGYAQYYIPKLGKATKRQRPKYELEYVTYARDQLQGDEHGLLPVPRKHLPKVLREPPKEQEEGQSTEGNGLGRYVPYGMRDLTVGSWFKLARKLGDDSHAKLRKRFRKYMYQGRGEQG